MTRLIDADRLKAHVKMQTDLVRNFSSISELGELATVMADGFEREVDIQPTVEAEPVRHGRWKFIRDEGDGNSLYSCSECGKGDIQSPEVIVPYCWHCGAKMDGEE